MKTCDNVQSRAQMLRAALFITKSQKQPNVHQLMNEYMQCGVYYSEISSTHEEEGGTDARYSTDGP